MCLENTKVFKRKVTGLSKPAPARGAADVKLSYSPRVVLLMLYPHNEAQGCWIATIHGMIFVPLTPASSFVLAFDCVEVVVLGC